MYFKRKELEKFRSCKGPIIDVRSPSEYYKGHLPNSINIPLFDNDGDDWAAGWILQVLKKFKPEFSENSKFNNWFNTYSDIDINYEDLQLMLVEQKFEEADRLTSSYLRKLAGKLAEKRGYVFYSEVKNMSGKDLETIDRLWTIYSTGRFGF